MVDINNPNNYKECKKKQYKIWACKPPIGTYAVNKLEQNEVWNFLKCKNIISKLEAKKKGLIPILDKLVTQNKIYRIDNDDDFLLSGTQGEVWATKLNKVIKTYNMYDDGQYIHINSKCLDNLTKEVNNNTFIDWFSIKTLGDNGETYMACYVPSSESFEIETSWGIKLNVNGKGVAHGKGDFILCDILSNGQPDLNNKWVVNGLVFADTYDCKKININEIILNKKVLSIPTKPKSLMTFEEF